MTSAFLPGSASRGHQRAPGMARGGHKGLEASLWLLGTSSLSTRSPSPQQQQPVPDPSGPPRSRPSPAAPAEVPAAAGARFLRGPAPQTPFLEPLDLGNLPWGPSFLQRQEWGLLPALTPRPSLYPLSARPTPASPVPDTECLCCNTQCGFPFPDWTLTGLRILILQEKPSI